MSNETHIKSQIKNCLPGQYLIFFEKYLACFLGKFPPEERQYECGVKALWFYPLSFGRRYEK
ncbi:hypothetical protein HORM4_610045 [Vibrio harveyi]|nr:hypothetical protein HORM4_610045 [Vibrio harveyi]